MFDIENFLTTGQSDAIKLGVLPFNVVEQLGEPERQSKKHNPLSLEYGPLVLLFWRKSSDAPLGLKEIAIDFSDPFTPQSKYISIQNWPFEKLPTQAEFRAFLQKLGTNVYGNVKSDPRIHLILPSGVVATFVAGVLNRLRLSATEKVKEEPQLLSDKREPGESDIREMFIEARRAMGIGAQRAALMIAWAGLEALLRRKARESGLEGKVGVQPVILLRQLQAHGEISPQAFAMMEVLRKLRTEIAHGLAPRPVTQELIARAIELGTKLLEGGNIE